MSQSNPVYVCHSFSSKEQVSFNFMAAVTICARRSPPELGVTVLEKTLSCMKHKLY